MKKIFVLLLFTSLFTFGFATPQSGDLLIYKGDTLPVYPFILEDYRTNPEFEKTFNKVLENIKIRNTACWRGYRAILEVRNDSLFLQKIVGVDHTEMDIASLWGKEDNIFVNWYSGAITNPQNLVIQHYEGWGGFYEYETDFVFKDGILIGVKEYHNTLTPSTYTEFETLKEFIRTNINYKNIKAISHPMLVVARIEETDENGKITKVSVLRGYSDDYDAEAIRVLKSIPQWQVIIRRGEQVQIPWAVPVRFEPRD